MLFLFVRGLRYRWLEYLLAALVVAMAIATLTVQRSLSSSTESQTHDLAHNLGKNMLVVPASMDLADFYSMSYDDSSMPDSYPKKIRGSKVGRHISLVQSRLYANFTMRRTPLIVVGEESTSRGGHSIPPPHGKVVLGETASRKLGLSRFDKLPINDFELVVTAVISKPPDGLDVGVFASLETAQEALNRPGEINAMRMAGCWCRLDVPALADQVEQILPQTNAVTVAGLLKAQKETIAEAKRYSLVTMVVTVLLIGGVVIVLILSQVRRGLREFGLLIATGAPPWQIALLFVVNAALVGGVGGLAGHFLGLPLTAKVASTLIGFPLPVPEGLLGITLALSITVSGVAALPPAAYAASLDPTEALREI